MKLYRVHKYHEMDGSFGFVWCSQRREAARIALEFKDSFGPQAEPEIEVFEIPSQPTRKDILRLLNRVADHADNG